MEIHLIYSASKITYYSHTISIVGQQGQIIRASPFHNIAQTRSSNSYSLHQPPLGHANISQLIEANHDEANERQGNLQASRHSRHQGVLAKA